MIIFNMIALRFSALDRIFSVAQAFTEMSFIHAYRGVPV